MSVVLVTFPGAPAVSEEAIEAVSRAFTLPFSEHFYQLGVQSQHLTMGQHCPVCSTRDLWSDISQSPFGQHDIVWLGLEYRGSGRECYCKPVACSGTLCEYLHVMSVCL